MSSVRNQDLFLLERLFVFFTNQIQQMTENETQMADYTCFSSYSVFFL